MHQSFSPFSGKFKLNSKM